MSKRTTLIMAVGVLLLGVGYGLGRITAPPKPNALTLNPTAPPGSTFAYTLNDVYNRLNGGSTGSQSTFTEPGSGPTAGTMHTLNDIMTQAPAADNTNGVTIANVLTGKTFWGLNVTSGQWGLRTGTAAVGSNVSGANAAKTFTIPDGFYSGSKTAAANDTNLAAGNIKNGVSIFGVSGTFNGQTCSGTLNGTRWCDNGNGTVTDMTTGRVWLQKADWGGLYPFWASTSSATNAHDRAASLIAGATGANLTDGSVEGNWRLPTKTELAGLANGTEAVRSYDMRAFTGVLSTSYWSSTTSAGDTASAWRVYLSNGGVYTASKSNTAYVWPVRGGQ